jgi:8-oxo-dGTP pyrophosphatase MutT (NUDIX family)
MNDSAPCGRSPDKPPAWGSPDKPPAWGRRLPVKASVGMILLRKNATTGRPEALLARRRYTYAYAEFVHGRYLRRPDATLHRNAAKLLEGMTQEELFDIVSLNFEQMWYRIWLSFDNHELYTKKRLKFLQAFMQDAGGALRRQAMSACARGSLIWEPPKGRRQDAQEGDIQCATRELYEETGIEKGAYRILPDVTRRTSYVSAGTRYVCTYYLAVANPHLAATDHPARTTLRDLQHMAEVGAVGWHDIERIRLVDCSDRRLERLVAPAFRLMRTYLKGHWAARRPARLAHANSAGECRRPRPTGRRQLGAPWRRPASSD